MYRILVAVTITAMLSISSAVAQENLTEASAKNDTTEAVSSIPLHALYGGMGYGSNMIYLGSTISQNRPFGYSALTYGYNNEFFVSLSSMHLSGFKPFLSVYTGSLNYTHTFNSWFDIAAGLYGYHVAPGLRDTLFGSFIYSDLTLGIDWRLLYSKLSVGGLVMDQSQLYLQFRNSRYFQGPDIFNGKATISLDPYINIIFGTYITAETITITDTVVSTFPPFGAGRSKIKTSSETVYTRDFRIMEIDFGLPVSIDFDFVSLEVETGFVLPLINDEYYQSSKGFLLMLSAYFKIL